MSVKHLYIVRDVTRRFGISCIFRKPAYHYINNYGHELYDIYQSRGTGSLKPPTGLQPALYYNQACGVDPNYNRYMTLNEIIIHRSNNNFAY